MEKIVYTVFSIFLPSFKNLKNLAERFNIS